MRKKPAVDRRHYRHRERRGRLWAGMGFAVLFAALFSMAVAGLSIFDVDIRPGRKVEQAVAENTTGQIVRVEPGNCTKMDFNNLDGRLSDHQYIPCPDRRSINRDYEFSKSRLESFSKGFGK